MAKGLGAGYQSIAAMMISKKIVNVMMKGSGQFIHGLTYQAMPVQAAAALEVQRIIREDNLMENVTIQGAYLGKCLKDNLLHLPNVGDIRGRGLFWGIEFVKNKATKDPFMREDNIAYGIQELAMSPEFNITVYPGNGTVQGVHGDHIIIAPPYIVKKKDVDYIVSVISRVIENFFSRFS